LDAKERYAEWLKTDRWQDIRKQVFDRDGWVCRRCGSPRYLEAHHINYCQGWDCVEMIGTLCRRCHQWVHDNVVDCNKPPTARRNKKPSR
jgi:5-methylcytosine-specific restriction endonuclease McrA